MSQTFTRYFAEWLDWIVGQPLNANTDYAALDCRGFATAVLEFLFDSTSAPDGQLFIEWSSDQTTWYPFDFTGDKSNVFDPGSKFTITAAAGEVDVLALDADSVFALTIERPPPYLRWRWAADSGGEADGASSKNWGRYAPA